MIQVKTLQYTKQLFRFFLRSALLILFMVPGINHINAATYQSLGSIRSVVNSYLEEQQDPLFRHKIKIGKIDNRLRLVACTTKLETFFLPGSKFTGNTTVGVRCSSPREWTFYVPANVKLYKQVAVTRHPLLRGEDIKLDSIQFIEKDISTLNNGYFTQNNDLIGKITKRALPSGHIFTPKSLKSANLVLRGEEVSIIVKSNGFQVRVRGEALMNGSARQKIKVRNKASKKVLEAVVIGRGTVSARM